MATTAGPLLQHYQWTRDEYYRLVDHGFFTGRRVELIEGQIIAMGPMNSPHATAINLAEAVLEPAFGTGFYGRTQMPLSLGERSDPEPDLAVVVGTPRDHSTAHPTTAALVVEVADSSLAYDQATKGSLYAKARLADYWIINLPDRQIEVYRRPVPDPNAFAGWRYADCTIARVGDVLTPLAAPAARVAVADLLP